MSNIYDEFAEDLYRESPRGAFELESMKYGIMARTGLKEPEALELAVKIVAANKSTKGEKPMSDYFGNLSADEIQEAIAEAQRKKQAATGQGYTPDEKQIIDQAADQAQQQIQARRMQPKIDAYKAEMMAARGNKRLGQQIKERYRVQGVPVDSISFTV